MSRAREYDYYTRWGGIGFTFYPYQFSLGFSLRYWSCIYAPSFRIHLGPFKVWGYISLGKGQET